MHRYSKNRPYIHSSFIIIYAFDYLSNFDTSTHMCQSGIMEFVWLVGRANVVVCLSYAMTYRSVNIIGTEMDCMPVVFDNCFPSVPNLQSDLRKTTRGKKEGSYEK